MSREAGPGDPAPLYAIRPDERIALFRFGGKMTVSLGAEIFLAYVRDPAFDPRHAMLIDGRAVDQVEASFLSIFARVMQLAPEIARFREPVSSVVLVSGQTVFGHVRMLGQVLDLTSKIQMTPVWTEAEAMTTLGRGGGDFAALFTLQP